MKFVLAICACVAFVFAQQEITPKTALRELPADILRDFPGACFASTACRVFQVNQTWPLSPFCGQATCLQGPTGLLERVEDCGLRPKESPGCKIVNQADLEKAFPACCPKYVCEAGKELLYPTEAELKAAAEAAQAAAAKAAAAASSTTPPAPPASA